MTDKIPVTILTGFLGSGKTTLLNRILKERHGQKIAVIENEFGEAGVDNEILLNEGDEQIIVMNNGCICCTVRGDLVRILGSLVEKRKAGELDFERVIVETTGLADPAPVAQTFFVDKAVENEYRIDAIVTLVDAKHAPRQLDEHAQAKEQVGFADRLLLSKTDLVSESEAETLIQRLKNMNPRAPIKKAHFGEADIADLLDIHGFDLTTALQVDPHFLHGHGHHHADDVSSFVYRSEQAFDMNRLNMFFGLLIKNFGTDMLRYKGILNIEGNPNRLIFQGVYMVFNVDQSKPWATDEKRESVLVFIGRNLPRTVFEQGLALCVVGNGSTADILNLTRR